MGGKRMDNSKSILLGNGFDVQLGGDDYLNRWIMTRLIIKARMGKYDCLFRDNNAKVDTIKGDEIVCLLERMITIAQNAINGRYDKPVDAFNNKHIKDALLQFKESYKDNLPTSIEQIGIEYWILIFQLYLITQPDLINQYNAVKKGLEWMILDAIYCEGNIQSLYKSTINNIKLKEYFDEFQYIFTINYDHNLEKITNRNIMHLHGDFDTKIPGMCNIKRYNCSAILDYSGELKYNTALGWEKTHNFINTIKESVKSNPSLLIDLIQGFPVEAQEITKMCIEKNINFPKHFYFDKLENLGGELTILGVSPNNDSHIFSCINKSNVSNVVFYQFLDNKSDFEKNNITIPINKPYRIENVQILWDKLEISKPIATKKYTLTSKQVNCLNSMPLDTEVTKSQIEDEINSIPSTTRGLLKKMLVNSIKGPQFNKTPNCAQELLSQIKAYGSMLKSVSISPQTLFALYFSQPKK